MRAGSSGNKRFHRKTTTFLTEINVTPFVDVMLVLLIIFMVTAPMMHSGVSIDLPKEKVGSLEIREENVVSVRKDGAIFLNDKRITMKELENSLKSLAAASRSAEVFLRGDSGIAYGKVMQVMALIKNSGIEKLGMVTEIPAVKGGSTRK